jgi:hypothetical protein
MPKKLGVGAVHGFTKSCTENDWHLWFQGKHLNYGENHDKQRHQKGVNNANN